MRKLNLFISILFFTQDINAQSTFFEKDQVDFGWKKVGIFYKSFDDKYFGFYHCFQMSTRYEVICWYDENGKKTSEHGVSVQYDDVYFSSLEFYNDSNFLYKGNGMDSWGRWIHFTISFNDRGKENWSMRDSIYFSDYAIISPSLAVGMLTVKDTARGIIPGNYLAWIDPRDGSIKKYYSNTELFSLDSSISKSINQIRFIKKVKDNVIFVSQNAAEDSIQVLEFDHFGNYLFGHLLKSKKPEKVFSNKDVYFLSIPDTVSPFYTHQIIGFRGHKEFFNYQFKNDSSFSNIWLVDLIKEDQVFINNLPRDSLYSFGSNDYLWISLDGELKRKCTYKLKTSSFWSFNSSVTQDHGVFSDADVYNWGSYNAGIIKTDSLGLVYNTDVICDCKDYNTGIGEQEAATENVHVTVFPNPASEKVVVQLRNPTQVKVELQSLNGQVIQSQEEYGQRFMFEVGDLPKGIYLLQVQSESGARVIRKLVVQ